MMFLRDLKTACLEYFVGTTHVFCLLIDGDGRSEKFCLARVDEIYPLIESFTTSLKSVTVYSGARAKGLDSFSLEWGKRLLPPFEALEPFDILIIIPHYWLHRIPFQTIWISERRQFLGAIFGLAYNASAALFRHCMNRNTVRASELLRWQFAIDDEERVNAPPPPKRCVGIGIDVVGSLTPEYQELAEEFKGHFEEPKSRIENIRILMQQSRNYPFTGYAPAQSLEISPTRRIKLGLEAENWEAICIVCHGHHDEYSPQNSGLLLKKNEFGVWKPVYLHKGTHVFDFRDEPFRSVPSHIKTTWEAEIMTLAELSVHCQTNAQLVALYGCHTAAGEMTSAQTFNSIAHQWLRIGAASVIANLWEVDIDVLRRLNPVFLRNWLTRRQPKAIALKEAVRALLESNESVPPHRWGTMALFGDWL